MNRLTEYIRDQSHFVATQATKGAGKGALLLMNGGHSLTHGAHGLMAGMNSTASTLGLGGAFAALGGPAGIIFMGGIAGISAAAGQMEYRHHVGKMRRFYQDEIAAKLGKDVAHVTDDDLHLLAKGDASKGIEKNEAIANEIGKERSKRNLGIAISAGLTLGIFAVMSVPLMIGAGGPVMALAGVFGGMGVAGTIAGVSIAETLAHVAIGMTIYNVLKKPLHVLGEKIFGLEKETPHEHIVKIKQGLEKGKEITREQVLDVMISSNKQLEERIAREYGQEYHEMDERQKQRVAVDVSKHVALDQVTVAINHREYDPAELIFAVEGQESGFRLAPPKAEGPQKGIMARTADRLKAIFSRAPQEAKQAAVPVTAAAHETTKASYEHDEAHWHPAHEQQQSNGSFAERYASRKGQQLGHVERLEQSREEPGIGTTQLA